MVGQNIETYLRGDEPIEAARAGIAAALFLSNNSAELESYFFASKIIEANGDKPEHRLISIFKRIRNENHS